MQHHEILLIHSDPNPAARTLSPLPGPALWCPLGAGGDQSPVPPFPRREEGLELCAQRMLCPAPNAGCLTLPHAGREGKEPSSNYCAIFVHERREASKRHAAAGNLMALGELRDRALQLRLFFFPFCTQFLPFPLPAWEAGLPAVLAVAGGGGMGLCIPGRKQEGHRDSQAASGDSLSHRGVCDNALLALAMHRGK